MAIRHGMLLFRQGEVSGSLVEFGKAIELDPRQKAYLRRGAEQFLQNPNDTEESLWCFLCEAQLYGIDEARKRFLKVGRNPRPVMREAYNMFKDGGDPEKFVAQFSGNLAVEYFCASLYAGLYYGPQVLPNFITCQSSYGQRSDDYMASPCQGPVPLSELELELVQLKYPCLMHLRNVHSIGAKNTV